MVSWAGAAAAAAVGAAAAEAGAFGCCALGSGICPAWAAPARVKTRSAVAARLRWETFMFIPRGLMRCCSIQLPGVPDRRPALFGLAVHRAGLEAAAAQRRARGLVETVVAA